jgi:RNA polymerase sigma-70 factor (ECF subfamily)
VLACQKGDNSAFGELYDKHIKDIYRFVYYKTHHKETAEDLTSRTFMKAYENIKTYRSTKASFSVWLYKIARNTVIDHYRTRKMTSNIEDVWDLKDNTDIAENTDVKIKMEEISEYMKELSSDQRDIIIMRIWQGLSYKEIAKILGKKEASCRMLYLRGINKLKDKISLSIYIAFLLEYLK